MGALTMTAPKLEPFFDSEDAPDPFDPAALRLKPDYIETAGVKKLLTTVPVRPPGKHDFVRVRPEQEFHDTFGLIRIGDDREYYLVPPTLVSELTGEFAMYTVYTVINRQNTLHLWPVRLPGPDGKMNDWWRSAHEAAVQATQAWVRVMANKNLGAYEIMRAAGVMSEPEWPEHSFRDLLRIAFRDRLIDRVDHPVIKQLRGLG
jgi:hypothetical protein